MLGRATHVNFMLYKTGEVRIYFSALSALYQRNMFIFKHSQYGLTCYNNYLICFTKTETADSFETAPSYLTETKNILIADLNPS